ncbi:protein PALS1-like isoform X2 [Lineus longissimus]|uniref:protein PALS1-like isoform X2 n=1 Tax=Lineus longissimus TaxID=88925 RepID=UPI002B4F54D0
MALNVDAPSKMTNCVDLSGYVILLVEGDDGGIKLYGSPADRADLQVGDEILEVNGRRIDGTSHADIISHIHKCIKSRTICLKVKRRASFAEVADVHNVQDAYVIAVEEKAKQRLEKLSAVHKIQPVDMTKLPNQEEKENMDIESYNNPFRNNKGNNMDSPHKRGKQPVHVEANINVPPVEAGLNGGHFEADINGPNVDTTRMNGYVNGGSARLDNTNPFLPAYQYAGSEGGSSVSDSDLYRGPSDFNTLERGVQQANNVQEEIMVDNTTDFNSGYTGIIDGSDGPHREMAIDVPAGFRGSLKEPPRLPSHIGPSPPGTPKKERKTADKSGSSTPKSDRDEQLQRIRKHQEDLRKRRDEEDRLLREQEFLRASLRGSKKLQALEQRPPPPQPVGFENEAFVEEGDHLDGSLPRSALRVTPPEPGTLDRKQQYEPTSQATAEVQAQPIDLEKITASLNAIKSKLNSAENKDDITFLNRLFQDSRFQKTVAVHQKVLGVSKREPCPQAVCHSAQRECLDIMASSSLSQNNPYVQELQKLLEKPEMQGLLLAHDRVSYQYQYTVPCGQGDDDDDDDDDDGDLPVETIEGQYGGDSIKIIRIQKSTEPLGATVRNEGGGVFIGRIVKGGAAEKSGLLHEGDEVLEVNQMEMRGRSVNEVSDLLAGMTGILTFMIVPNKDFNQSQDETLVHVRAHFNYDPEEDMYIPCRELGISFVKGDILHIINQDDANWWQAFREGEEDHTSLAGLIPSKNFQEQREAVKQVIVQDSSEDKKKKNKLCARKKKKGKKKALYNAHTNDDFEAEEILTYEEVARYYPQPNRKRPIVMVGPPHVGRQELRRRLMESDLDRFAAAVPHTSRPRKETEVDGQDYHFVPRSVIESDICSNKFVEHGEFEKNIYGTSLEAIRMIINSGKVCVLDLHPQDEGDSAIPREGWKYRRVSLKILKMSDLKPYIIFIAPPNIEKLRQNCAKLGTRLADDALKEVIDKSREMEENFGHYFDTIIINYDMDRTFDELLHKINSLEIEPQWVPAQWMQD